MVFLHVTNTQVYQILCTASRLNIISLRTARLAKCFFLFTDSYQFSVDCPDAELVLSGALRGSPFNWLSVLAKLLGKRTGVSLVVC